MFGLTCFPFAMYQIFYVNDLGAMAYRGDLIACEVDFQGVHEGRIPVFFFLNGREVGRCLLEYTSGQKLIPFVALANEGITLLTKMCHRDGVPSNQVTVKDLHVKIDHIQKQLEEQRLMISELRYLVRDLKDVKEKAEPGKVFMKLPQSLS